MMTTNEHPSLVASPAKSTGHKFQGCSPIQKYEMLEKLGEGTFGYVSSSIELMIARYGRRSCPRPANYLLLKRY